MKSNSQDVRAMWDRIGFWLSGLCLIHCLILPMFAVALPWLGMFIQDERIHLGFAAVTVPVAMIAFIPGFLKHQRQWVLGFGLAGAGLLLGGALGEELFGHHVQHVLTVLGGLLLVSGHYFNYRFATNVCSGELCTHHAS